MKNHTDAVLSRPTGECTILTTEANDTIRPLHERMPIVLPAGALRVWMNPRAGPDELTPLMTTLEQTPMSVEPAFPATERRNYMELHSGQDAAILGVVTGVIRN